MARWQERIEPAWRRVFANCHLTRPVTRAISDAGFVARPIKPTYVKPGPRWAGRMEWGTAKRA